MAEESEEVELAQNRRCCLAVIQSIGLFMLSGVLSVRAVELEYATQIKPAPLKGLASDQHHLNSFDWGYLPLRSVMTGPNEFDWKKLETLTERSSSKGKTIILRPVLDLFSSYSCVPNYLTNIEGATLRIDKSTDFFSYPQNGIVPIYTHAAVRTAITNFIQTFAQKYDGDPRIGFVEIGLIGTWGEWYNINMKKWPETMVPPEVANEVLQAYQKSFTKTKLLMRWPNKEFRPYPFGYHDDWFAEWRSRNSLYRSETNVGVVALTRWMTQPIGARLHPEFGKGNAVKYLDEEISPERLLALIQRDHISWLRPRTGDNWQDISPALQRNLEVLAPKMGYELYVSQAEWMPKSGTLQINVTVTNTAVAPFYYPWTVEVGLSKNNKLQKTWTTDWDITRIIPGMGAITYQFTLKEFPTETKAARLLLHVINPLKNGFPLRFANKTQDADLDGWLTLGEIGKN
jgi:hypothetical protein